MHVARSSERIKNTRESTLQTVLGGVTTAALAGFLFLWHWASQILDASRVAQHSLPGEMVEEILSFSPRLGQVEMGLGSGCWLLSCHRTPALWKPQREWTQTHVDDPCRLLTVACDRETGEGTV